ncbi:MAG TPA: TolC family protein [Cyclobacteriaceae bacterium]
MKHKFFAVVLSAFSFSAFAQEKIQLDQVISLALEKNFDIQLAKNNSSSASTNNDYAWAAFLPQLNGTASSISNSTKQRLEFKDATKNIKGTNEANTLNGSVQLNWTLFDGTKMFATRQRIAIMDEQGELLIKDQMVNSIASVITTYYNIVKQKQQLMAIQEQMAVSDVRVKLAEKKLQVGTGAKPELLQARVDYNSQRTQVIQQETAIVQLKAQLNALLGSQLPASYDVVDSIAINLDLKEDEVISNSESTNYSLKAARRNFNIATLSLHERRAELFPILSFTGAYTYTRADNTKLVNPYGTIFSLSNGYNYGFSLAIPILNGLTTRRQIELAKITYSRQQVLYDQMKTNVDVGLRNAFVNYENAKKILLIEEETILLAKENVFIALESFKKGTTTFIELRTAQQSLADAYNQLITARYNAKLAETELLRLNGGLLK